MADSGRSNNGVPLDETQWSDPNFPGGLHNNSILFYFAESPFFDITSNNSVLFQQGLSNPVMFPYLQTRDQFEGRLKTMSGLEFLVAQEPAETGPGMGTGVWVINKQTRRKRQNEEDEVIVHASYFVVGWNVYMAPALFDVLGARMANISSSFSKIFSMVDSVQKWSPAYGRVYQTPKQIEATKARGLESHQGTPIPDGVDKASSLAKATDPDLELRLMEESLGVQERYGGEYMDENPITGRPGEFHLSSTGRKVNLSAPKAAGPLANRDSVLPAINTKVGDSNPLARNGKETKSPKTAGMPKPKRRKSKAGATPS
ncbi:MED6-domain-containing protein [Thozetella sp. PMI_491]|nr:MED6-domain-containing protein [Thozetella sp. PMI_491]